MDGRIDSTRKNKKLNRRDFLYVGKEKEITLLSKHIAVILYCLEKLIFAWFN